MDLKRNLRPRSNVDYLVTKSVNPRSRRAVAKGGSSSTARTKTSTKGSKQQRTRPDAAKRIRQETPDNALNRPAEPRATNAPLVTPKGSKVVIDPSTRASDNVDAPQELSLKPTTTTANILDEACAHLIQCDPRLKPLIEKYPCDVFSATALAEECDPFSSLSSSIMAQQARTPGVVSGAAASAIKRKFIALFHRGQSPDQAQFPTPQEVAACDVPFLRQAGLSERKAEYIQGLAERFASGQLSAAKLVYAPDDELMETLTAVRGLGRWSVEMFACFSLKRMDILSTGDLGVQRGMAVFLGKGSTKTKGRYMTERDMQLHSAKFAPYRTLFMWYMWRVENVDTSAMEKR